MNFSEIMKYLEQGFTLEQIEQMKSMNDKNTASRTGASIADSATPKNDNPPVDPVVSDNQANAQPPEWAVSLNKTIENLTRTMQATALMSATGKEPINASEQADGILASIINPTYGKDDK